MEIDELTGLPKNVHIEYFLNNVSLGKTMVSEKSMAQNRIAEAKAIGVRYYNRFVLDNGRADSGKVKMIYNGVLQPYDDFKTFEATKNQPYNLVTKHNTNGHD